MILIHDLGRIYPAETSKQKKHMGIVECPVCKGQAKAAIPRALKPEMCIKCFRKSKALPTINTSDLPMRLIKDLGKKFPTKDSIQSTRYGIFECSQCSAHIELAVNDVKHRASGLCDTCYKPIRNSHIRTHGDSGKNTPYASLYRRWNHLRARCNNPSDSAYNDYGGRGITVCTEWDSSYEVFKKWSLANGYEEHLTIDRIDGNGNYQPNNCRWASMATQAANRAKSRSIKQSSIYKGVTLKKGDTKYIARIMLAGKSIALGSYITEKEAAIAYNKYVLSNNLEHSLNKII